MSSSNTVVVIPMTLASASASIAPTTCTTLAQACANPGGC
jgi:hypothetical protein